MNAPVSLDPRTRQFLDERKQIFLAGQFVDAKSDRSFVVENPSSAEPLAQVPESGADDVHAAVLAAKNAVSVWGRMTPADRSKTLWRLADLMEQHQDVLAQLESLDNGKPLIVAQKGDVSLAIEMFRYMAGWCTKIDGRTFNISVPGKTPYMAYTLKEPVGVVAAIVPWNFPLMIATWKMAPALAAGCCVILKPAEQTPLSALYLGKLIQQAGFPEGTISILPGLGSTGRALVEHPLVDKVSFTGSNEVGRLILEGVAHSNLKKVTLELGGKSPNIIFADADMDRAIKGAASGIFFNHGQCCSAGSRLLIERSVFDEVVAGVVKIAESIRLGDGLDPKTQMGPLVSGEQRDRVMGLLASGIKEGVEVLTGGEQQDGPGYFVKPTVLGQAMGHMQIVKEEVFGPVVTAMPFESAREAAAMANDTIYGLAAGVWTRDIAKAHAVSAQIKAGTTWINCYNVFDPALPFGGYKQSGWGRDMGEEAIEQYLETKSVCLPTLVL